MTTTAPGLRTAHPWRVAGAVSAAVALDVAIDPSTTHIPLCPFHAVTGAWCPLCGGLRAVASLAHGDVAAALHDNVLVVASVPVVMTLWLLSVLRPRRRSRIGRRSTLGIVALAVLFTVVRNLPAGEFLSP